MAKTGYNWYGRSDWLSSAFRVVFLVHFYLSYLLFQLEYSECLLSIWVYVHRIRTMKG